MGRSLLQLSSLSFLSPWLWLSSNHPKTHSFWATADASESISSYLSSAADMESFSLEHDVIMQGLDSERLFFEPGGRTRSILEESVPFIGGVVVTIESEDPYRDYRKSMEEMVMAYRVNDHAWLDEMLSWYFRLNEKEMHGVIVGAFLDLLVSLADSRCPYSCSFSSSSSTFSGR